MATSSRLYHGAGGGQVAGCDFASAVAEARCQAVGKGPAERHRGASILALPFAILLSTTVLAALVAGQIAVDFTAVPTSGPNPLRVAFTDTSTGESPVLRIWDFGDGGSSCKQNPPHFFSSAASTTFSVTPRALVGQASYRVTYDDLITANPVIDASCPPPRAPGRRDALVSALVRRPRGPRGLAASNGLSGTVSGQVRGELANHSLCRTALVNEACLRLVDQRIPGRNQRAQFFAVAARIIRRVLVDRARARNGKKRGGGATRGELSTIVDGAALRALPARCPRTRRGAGPAGRREPCSCAGRRLRFFAGLTVLKWPRSWVSSRSRSRDT